MLTASKMGSVTKHHNRDWSVQTRPTMPLEKKNADVNQAAMRQPEGKTTSEDEWRYGGDNTVLSNKIFSSSENNRERVRNRLPVPLSSENMPPMPSTTSMMSCVCFQYSN
jgi:hypothetical protein